MIEALDLALNVKATEGDVEISFPTAEGHSIVVTRRAALKTAELIDRAATEASKHTVMLQRGTGAGLRQSKQPPNP